LEGIDGNPKFVVCSSSWGTFIHSLDTHLRQSHIASETPLFFFMSNCRCSPGTGIFCLDSGCCIQYRWPWCQSQWWWSSSDSAFTSSQHPSSNAQASLKPKGSLQHIAARVWQQWTVEHELSMTLFFSVGMYMHI
jgi:hypothetical protein